MGFSASVALYKRAKRRVILKQFEEYGYNFCEYCKIIVHKYEDQIYYRDKLTTDHVKSKSNKGKNIDSNLKVCCLQCNQEKGSMTVEEFVKSFGVINERNLEKSLH